MTLDEFCKNMLEPGSPLEQLDIARFEESLGAELPTQFAELQLRTNGGAAEFAFSSEDKGAPWYLSRLFPIKAGIARDQSIGKLRKMWSLDMEWIPLEFIPIGDDPEGNIYCLRIKEPNSGEVRWFDHESDRTELVLESFDELVFTAKSSRQVN